MKKKPIRIFILISMLTLVLSSCGANSPVVETTTPNESINKQADIRLGDTTKGSILNLGELGSTDVYLAERSGVIFPGPRRFRSSEQEDLDIKISQYATIIEMFPDLNFYALYLELIQFSQHNPMNADYPNVDAGQALEYFTENKPAELTLETLPLTSFDDHMAYYYRTDHHWNVQGIMAGYKKIYKMLANNYPEISPMIKPKKLHAFKDIEFVGTWARELGYKADPEPFTVAVLDLPPYSVYDSEGNELEHGRMEEYFAGDYGDEFYTDHYVAYYGDDDIGYLEYVSQNGAERNLLIIGDSYINPIEPLLSSHYHHTYCIDVRRLPDYHFSMSEFLTERDVDDVLFLGGGDVIFYTWRWTIKP